MSIEKVVYSASATSTGGREGRSQSADKVLDLQLSTPKEMGGAGGPGTNPEQLFACGYSACFLGALKHVAAANGAPLPESARVSANVGIGAIPGGFGIEVALTVELPELAKDKVEALVAQAHKVCPYSNATRGNIEVSLVVA